MKLVDKKISFFGIKTNGKKNIYQTNEKQLENIFTTLI